MLRHDQTMLSRVSRGLGQAVFVMYRFDDITVELILSFRVNISAKCLTVAMDRVIIPIQADRPTYHLGTCFEMDFHQVAEMFLNFSFEYPGMFLNFTECSRRVS